MIHSVINLMSTEPQPCDIWKQTKVYRNTQQKRQEITNFSCPAMSPVQQVASEYKPFPLSSQNIPAGLSRV